MGSWVVDRDNVEFIRASDARIDLLEEHRDALGDSRGHAAISEGDIVIDLQDHKRLRVVEQVADDLVEHYEKTGKNLLAYETHPWLPVSIDDAVYRCEYLKEIDELHRHGDTYPFPAGRLARVPERVGDWERDAE